MKLRLPRRKKDQGFTLIELMIVVVIIGILAATAIPAFLRFVTRSKTTEAGLQLKEMFVGAAAYYANQYTQQGWSTTTSAVSGCFIGNADTGLVPDNAKHVWLFTGTNAAGLTGTTPGIAGLGWGPADPLYYRYEISDSATGCPTPAIVGPALTFRAIGNLDADATTSVFEMSGGVLLESGLSHMPLYVENELE
ncbi:MAG: prepilin-type N-terminal cleavage/methylation domain-containing protein [Sandaracinaceae bacterium]|nr:prepilin-type N-terminal cleavage/methylation domain-containing protein [Sandaracinaceae bacterium]